MFNSIRKKLIGGFLVIISLIFLSTIFNAYSFIGDREHITNIKNKTMVSLELSNKMKNDILQVRLYITNASAMRNTGELKMTDKYANDFNKNASALLALNPKYNSSVKSLTGNFNRFYDNGKEMVNYYVNGSMQAGEMMNNFDSLADEVMKSVDDIQKDNQKDVNNNLSTIEEHISMELDIGIIITIFASLLSIIIVLVLTKGIRRPINYLLETFIELESGEGDLTKRIDINTKDEIGKMAQAFNRFMDSLEILVKNIKKNSYVVSNTAESLSSSGIKATKKISLINNHMGKVTEDTQSISESINQITSSVSEIASISQNNAYDAQDINGKTEEVNKLIINSKKYSQNVKLEMENIEKISTDTVEITKKLGNEADEIGKIVDTIKSITEQTNLLALNASIEAARAGEQGKGFGVVANEIRTLAENNNNSTVMIENIIKRIQTMIEQTVISTAAVGKNINNGRKMVEGTYDQLQIITDNIGKINEGIQNIAASTEEQGASTEKLTSIMDSINVSNNEISGAIQEIASGISTQAETVKELSLVAQDLNVSSSNLIGFVNKFKI
ncbi:methyl-accepting chemotaxis protein [Clostridium sp. Mt-5]|uniref:Methyl-accepting chemotaxis protein n=1 Tax=Clostridium moutaii TaxID=3240932 RepID=A0ABV4BWM0_9CLOT